MELRRLPEQIRQTTENPENETEVKNTIQAHIKDGEVVTKLVYWLKKNIGRFRNSAADYLEMQRVESRNISGFIF